VDAGFSAKSLDRPGLQRRWGCSKRAKLNAARREAGPAHPQRCGPRHLVERYFAPGKAALLSVGEQIDTRSAAGGRPQRPRLGEPWEREAIGEGPPRRCSTRRARASTPAGGRLTAGACPDGDRLEPDPQEEAARAVARQLRAQGLSLRAVAAELHQRGIRSRTGRGFAPVQVKRMVAYPRLKEWAYAGVFFNMTGAAVSHAGRGDAAGT